MSRSGDVCVVALVDQWYLTYGEDEWRSQVRKYFLFRDFLLTNEKAFRHNGFLQC